MPAFLVIGLGSIGRRHLRNLVALGQQEVVLLRTRQSTLPEEDLAGFVQVTSFAAALQHRPAAAVIANPTGLHLATARQCAEAGLHLLLEKPASHTLEGTEALAAEVARRSLSVLVGYQFRFDPGLTKIKRLLEEKALGRIVSVQAHWGEYLPDWHPWEDYRQSYSVRPDLGGGLVLTLSHPIDYLRWLFGEVTAVAATLQTRGDLGIEVEDVADLQLHFAEGLNAHVHLNYVQRPPVHRLEIIGSTGTLQWESATSTVRLYTAASTAWEEFSAPAGFERNHLFVEETGHFLRCVQGAETSRCTLDDGLAATAIALAAAQSSTERRTITLPALTERRYSPVL